MRLDVALTEYLDRAAHLYDVPLHPPTPASRHISRTPAWMDAEREFHARWWPERVGTIPNPLVRISAQRREVLTRRLEQIEAHGRVPRVCLYAAGPSGPDQKEALDAAREFVSSNGWRMKGEHSADVYGTSPDHRAGWGEIVRMIRGSFLDGVVVPTYDDISHFASEYEVQLGRIDMAGGFVALVSPETGGSR